MRKKSYFLVAGLMAAQLIFSQSEIFDIATFVAPAGWQRVDSNGIVAFFNSKTTMGLTSFCQIFLYPGYASNGSGENNFKAEWVSHVVRATGITQKPKTETQKTSDGWTIVTGNADVSQNGVTYTCILVTSTGFGRVMSVLVNIAGQEFVADMQNFFAKLELSTKNLENGKSNVPANSSATSLSDYVFLVPGGWTSVQYPDGIVLSSPASNTGEKCNITLWPMRQGSGNLQNDATNLFNAVFKNFIPAQTSTSPSMIRGLSPQGWEYFIMKQGIVLAGGNYQAMFGFVFVAKLGSMVAAISGISKDPLVSSCFGLMLTDVWPKFFYSLQFKNWKERAESMTSKRIVGVWMAVTSTAADRFVFAPNGRFAGAAAAQKYYAMSSGQVLAVTDAYFGDGSWQTSGNRIMLKHDNDKSSAENGWWRIEEESKDGGKTWAEKLFLLRTSKVDGSEYELAYHKE